jgi:hypothetical protein
MTKLQDKRLHELSQLKLPALQARFAEVTGKTNKSPNRTFLVRSIIAAMETADQAKKSREAGAPRKTKKSEKVVFQVLPVRMETDLVEELDEAWRRQGLRTRMQLFRLALSSYLQNLGETEVADRLMAKEAK